MLWVILFIHEDLLSVYNKSDITPPVTRDPCLQRADHLMVMTDQLIYYFSKCGCYGGENVGAMEGEGEIAQNIMGTSKIINTLGGENQTFFAEREKIIFKEKNQYYFFMLLNFWLYRNVDFKSDIKLYLILLPFTP